MSFLAGWLLLWACRQPTDPEPTNGDDATTETDSDTDTDGGDTGANVLGGWPDVLSATGLYADLAAGTLAEDVLAYEVAWPLWTDGATKGRYLYLPEGQQIDTTNADHWEFPVGTKAWKEFTRDGVRIETRYLELTGDGWVRVAYLWRDDGTDADPVPDGVEDARGTAHDVPSAVQCETCHAADGLNGIGAVQLGADSPTGTLEALAAANRLTQPVTASTVVPGDGVVRETLGYLHGNCGSCHNDWAPIADKQHFRGRMLVGTATPEESPAYHAVNHPSKHFPEVMLVAPGDPAASELYNRISTREQWQMPPIGSELVDPHAVETIGAWIESLPVE